MLAIEIIYVYNFYRNKGEFFPCQDKTVLNLTVHMNVNVF